MGTLAEDLTSIKNVEDTLIANKVARFAYTDTAYADNDADGVDTYDFNHEQNIPNPTTSVLKVNSTVLDKGYRAQASSITRMLINHFFGRVSYNLNKINDNMSALIATLRAHTGTANGFATLDANGRIPYSQLPESAVELKGYWNAQTNTPTLADGTGDNGDEYFVDTAGSQDLGSGEQYFKVGDRVVYTGGIWKNIDSSFVRTVNTQAPNAQGNVVNIIGKSYMPITKGFLSAMFGRLLARKWTQGTGANTNYIMYTPVYANGLWVCGSYEHGMWWSEDGKSWTQGTGANTNYTMYTPVYANGLWVCESDNGIWWSEDGKSWTQGTEANTRTQYLVYANGLWVCGSISKGIWWSEDGKSWTQGTGANITYSMQYLVYANGLWVCGSYEHGMWWSEDGKSWTQGTGANTTELMRYLVYANGLWVCGSFNKGIWWSEDGKSWTQVTGATMSYSMQNFVYANGLWVCGSINKGIWWSEDGKSWTQVTGATMSYAVRSLVYINGLWVYSSDDHGMWWGSDIETLIAEGTIDLGANIPLVN